MEHGVPRTPGRVELWHTIGAVRKRTVVDGRSEEPMTRSESWTMMLPAMCGRDVWSRHCLDACGHDPRRRVALPVWHAWRLAG